jgi:hypothetical protein
MEIKLARKDLKSKPKSVEFDAIKSRLEKEEQVIFYFDKENSHKDILDLVDMIGELGKSVYHREVKYGLDENDYLYEVHAL